MPQSILEMFAKNPFAVGKSALVQLESKLKELLSEKAHPALRAYVNRERPPWTEGMADKHDVRATLRPVGRPRKVQSPV